MATWVCPECGYEKEARCEPDKCPECDKSVDFTKKENPGGGGCG